MDPQARHSTWSLLQKFKKERNTTILLTTHFMDEVINLFINNTFLHINSSFHFIN